MPLLALSYAELSQELPGLETCTDENGEYFSYPLAGFQALEIVPDWDGTVALWFRQWDRTGGLSAETELVVFTDDEHPDLFAAIVKCVKNYESEITGE